METLETRALEALREIMAEIDNGHVGRLTAIEGLPGWRETAGMDMARDVLKSVDA